MILPATTDTMKWAMYLFLCERGVKLARSEDFQALGRLSRASGEPKLIGVVGYNNFCGNVCSMHTAGDGNWVSREFIRAAFGYPFRQLNLVSIITPISSNNPRSLRFVTHMGFQEVYRVENGWEDGADMVFLEMKREGCRWMREGTLPLVERKAA